MPASLGCELSIVMDGGAAARTQALVSAKPPTRSVFGADRSAPGVGEEHAARGLSSWGAPTWLWHAFGERIFAHDGFAG